MPAAAAAALERFDSDTVMTPLHFVRRVAAGLHAMAQRQLVSAAEHRARIADEAGFPPLFPSP